MRKLMVFSAAILSCYSQYGLAADPLKCTAGFDDGFLPQSSTNGTEGPVDVKADSVQLIDAGTSLFSGGVDVSRQGKQLNADHATYNRNSGDISASGNVRVRDSGIVIKSNSAKWSLTNDKGTMVDAEYRLRQKHARGKASKVYRQGQTTTDLHDATYTTCAPGDNAWLLKANEVHLDHVTAVGSAENVVVRLGGVPIFYTPYISFPLNDERKSGFLVPSIGSSNETGFDLSTPYYWNIAPAMDATLTPRYMSDRGLMLNGRYRYLYESGEGKIDAGFLSSDRLKSQDNNLNPYYNEDRKHFSWQHHGRFAHRWHANVDYNYVSDNNYLEDFGSNLSLSSTSYLNRLLDVGYNGNNWDFTARLQGYQNLIDTQDPYQRLPQLLLRGSLPDQALGMTYGMKAEYVDFAQSDLVEGQRIDLEPTVSLPMRTSAFFATPRVALRYTQYNLTNDDSRQYDTNASRTLPIVSFDSGAYFERGLKIADSAYVQTLEPRAFYLYVPYRDQADIPVFDSALTTFNMTRLFSYDRYTGADRVGDANQLTLALTSRLVDQQTGRERLRLTVGQIQYFADRDVTLPDRVVQTRSDSDMVAEVAASLAKEWTVLGEMQWNPHGEINDMSSIRLRYRGDNGSLFNMAHRYRREGVNYQTALEQVDISAKVPLNKQWNAIGRYYRSLKDDKLLEGLAGIEYNSCCWAARMVVRDYVNDVTDNSRNLALFFQIELKGLGAFGNDTSSLLQQSIFGYQAD